MVSKDGNDKPPTKEEMKGIESGKNDNQGEDVGSTDPQSEPDGNGP